MQNILSSEQILGLSVDQDAYDSISLNRKSTFIVLLDENGEYVTSVNTLDMKNGQDVLFLAEVLRAAEQIGLVPINSAANFRGLIFRLGAVPTSELNSSLKRNLAKKEDWKKQAAPTAPQSHTQVQTPIQQVF